jgi:hypothetical protein
MPQTVMHRCATAVAAEGGRKSRQRLIAPSLVQEQIVGASLANGPCHS